MLLKDFISDTTARLTGLYPAVEARSLVLILVEDLLGVKRHTHILHPDFEIPQSKAGLLSEAADRLAGGEPVQYVTGAADFCGRRFHVDPRVLIPRPETEELCYAAETFLRSRVNDLDTQSSATVLDLCTGSGCIAWTIALDNAGVRVLGLDISDGALEVAENQKPTHSGAASGPLSASAVTFPSGFRRPAFAKCDILTPDTPALISETFGSADVILSNPPYILEREKIEMRPNVLDHEPAIALFVPDSDPLKFYKAIARIAERLLSPEGIGIVEINEDLGPETAEVFTEARFDSQIRKDFRGQNRLIVFRKTCF